MKNHLVPMMLVSSMSMSAYSENVSPTVSFPNSAIIMQSESQVRITPVVDDDGLPLDGNKNCSWDILSGTLSAITQSSPISGTYDFNFSLPGTYTLRYIATDGEFETSADLFITVGEGGITKINTHRTIEKAYKDARTIWADIKSNYYLDGAPSPQYVGFNAQDFTLAQDSEVIITLLYDGASLRNSLVWYDDNQSEESGGVIIWNDVATGPDAPLEQGSKASLGLLPQGTDLRFFIIQDGAGVGSTALYQDSSLNPNNTKLVASKFPVERENAVVLAFEDKVDGTDLDDLVIMIEQIPKGLDTPQLDNTIPGTAGLNSDRGSRGVRYLIEEQLSGLDECLGGIFQLPTEETTYSFEVLDDRSSMKYTLGVIPIDSLAELGTPTLLFREEAAKQAITILDDREVNPGDAITFNPHDHNLQGRRVALFVIPNNTIETFLRNPWRYTPKGNGENTKRQPLYSLPEANPDGLDQFFVFHSDTETVITIEDMSRTSSSDELGELSDESFDDIQIKISPALIATDRHNGYYGQTADFSIGYEANDGLAPDIAAYDERSVMKAAKGARRWDLLFSALTQPDGQFLVNEYGESLPISETGAISLNQDYEAGTRADFYIEQQRYGADVIETGIILEDADLIAEGIKMINWGFAQQASDGSFPNTGDAVHSTSLFLEAASRAGLALKRYKSRTYRTTIKEWRRKTHLTAHWFIEADLTGRDVNLEPYGHRYYLRAAALMQASRLTRDKSLDTYANAYAQSGIAVLQADGTMLEKGGFDASYQMVGMAFASRYFATARDSDIREQVSLMMWSGISRFLQEVQPSGEVTILPTSRTATESSRTGAAKRFDFKHTTKALVFAEEGLFMPGAEDIAQSIVDYYDK